MGWILAGFQKDSKSPWRISSQATLLGGLPHIVVRSESSSLLDDELLMSNTTTSSTTTTCRRSGSLAPPLSSASSSPARTRMMATTKRRAPATSGGADASTTIIPAKRPSASLSSLSPPRTTTTSPPPRWRGGGEENSKPAIPAVFRTVVLGTIGCRPLLFLVALLIFAPPLQADASSSWRRSSSSTTSSSLLAFAPRRRPFLAGRRILCGTSDLLSLGTEEARQGDCRTIRTLSIRGGAVEDDDDEDETSEDESEYDEASDGEEVTAVDDDEEADEEESDAEEGTAESSTATTATPKSRGKKQAVAAQHGAYDEPLVASPLLNLYASLAIMVLSKKVDLMSPIMVRIARFAFIAYLLLLQAFVLYVRIQAKITNDPTVITLQNPLSNMLQSQLAGGGGGVKSLASSFLSTSCTVCEYDLKQASSMQSGLIMNMAFMWFLHFKMQQVQPLLIQSLTGLLSLGYHPLFQSYVLGRNLERPFVTPTTPPQRPAEDEEEPSITTEDEESEPTLQAIEAASDGEVESEEEEEDEAEADDNVEEKEEDDDEENKGDNDAEVAGDDESDAENDQGVADEHEDDGEGGSKKEILEGEVTGTDGDADVKGDIVVEDPTKSSESLTSGEKGSAEPESAVASSDSAQQDGDAVTTEDS